MRNRKIVCIILLITGILGIFVVSRHKRTNENTEVLDCGVYLGLHIEKAKFTLDEPCSEAEGQNTYPAQKEDGLFEEDIDWISMEEMDLSYDIFVGMMISTCNLQSECYWDYGIIKDKKTDTWTSANAEYVNLCKDIYGINYEVISENTKEADERRLERDEGERIVDISTDGESVLIWQKNNWGSEVHLQIYHNNQKINDMISEDFYMGMFLSGQKFGILSGGGKCHDLMAGESYDLLQEKMKRSLLWMNETGKLAALIDREENYRISIFDIEEQRKLFEFDLCDEFYGNDGIGIRISQLKGNEESGKVLFYSSTSAYQMLYPEGRIEKLGDYMYNGLYSPDERYFIYTSPDDGVLLCTDIEKVDLYDIPKGIYIKKVGGPETVFVPIERPNNEFGIEDIYIRWVEKDITTSTTKQATWSPKPTRTATSQSIPTML